MDEAVTGLINGEIDFVAHVPGRYSEKILSNETLQLAKLLTRQSIVLLANSKKNGPLRSVQFRKALRSGINFDDVVKYGHSGNGRVSNSLTVDGEPFHNPRLENIVFEPRRLSSYIEDHSLRGHEFVMLITKPYDLAGSIIAKQMKDAGLKIRVEYGSDSDEIEAVLMKNQQGIVPDIDFLLTYCSHRYALGAFPLLILLHSRGNWSMTGDQNLDAMLDEALNEFDFQKQRQKFWAIDKYVYDNALVLPGFQQQDLYAMKRNISFTPHVTGYVYFKDVKFEK